MGKNMKQFQTKKLMAAQIIAANMLLAGGAASMPVSAEENVMEEVVVTASFRDSLKAALDVKRNSANMVDSILAEDIADFPDSNLADAMQRIPGVAITKEAGEGREITVRGLSSTFTRVMINNAMSQSLAAGSGGVRTDRAFDFNVFASEMFNRLDVHKTQSAELEEGSLGATVNLHTGRPFDYDNGTGAVNLQASYNEQSGKTSPRLSGMYSMKNEDETFGALVSVAYSERFVNNRGADTGRWEDDVFPGNADDAALSASWHPRFPRFADKTHDQERTGVTTSFQFRPSESTLVTLDGMFANMQSVRREPFMEAISLARSSSGKLTGDEVVADGYVIDANNSLVVANVANVDVRSEAFVAEWESDYKQYALTLDHEFSDDFRVKAMYSTSDSQLDNREATVIYEHFNEADSRRTFDYADAASSVAFDFTDMLAPGISYGFDTTNPANWAVSEFRDRVYDASSGSDSFKVDFAYDVNDNVTLKFGANTREYGYEIAGTRADRSFSSADGRDGTVDNVACGISAVVTAADGSVVNAGGQSFFMADDAAFATFRAATDCWTPAVRGGDTRDVTEETTGVYAQMDFDYDMNGTPIRGNYGVRYVETDLSATGINSGTTVTVDNSYSDVLPSLNISANVTDELVLRAAWSKVMSRPNLGDLNPGGSISTFGDLKVSYGNPFLEPFRSTNIDLSAEYYFDEGALLSFAYFDKDIESFPSSETVTLSWPEIGLPDSLLGAQAEFIRNADFDVSRKTNGGGGELSGYEIQYQQNLTFLPEGWMQNLGVIANMTSVESSVDSTGLRLNGQSNESYNFTAFYEDDKFSTRLAYSYRGNYTSATNSDVNKIQYRAPAESLDFSMSYELSDDLRLTLEALNLTNEKIADYTAPGIGRVTSVQTTGTQIMTGVSYKF
jgi:iron complex outermembrane recepter protein